MIDYSSNVTANNVYALRKTKKQNKNLDSLLHNTCKDNSQQIKEIKEQKITEPPGENISNHFAMFKC